MDSTDILMRIMEDAESEDVKKACLDAINAMVEVQDLRNKLRRSVQVPCKIGEKLYSVIGEDVQEYVIDGYRIEKDELYMTADNIFFKESKIGKYYFLSKAVAQVAHKNMYKGEKTG